MPIKILIVEDEIIISQDIRGALESIGYSVLGVARDFEGALKSLDFEVPDLVLLDIQLKGERTGIDLAKYIREQFHLPFIFITSFANKAIVEEVVATQPNGYLVKPFTEDDLFTSIELALHNFNEQPLTIEAKTGLKEERKELFKSSLFVKTGNLFKRVLHEDIEYLEADGLYTKIYTKEREYVERCLLRTFEERLDPKQFMRVHRSYMVHLNKIEALQADSILLNGKSIPLGRTYRDKLFDMIR